jgi:hypothetical protein
LRRFDGVYRWFIFRATPAFDNNGRVVKWFGTNTDIEDRKRAEGLLAGENRVLEMTAKGNSLESILGAQTHPPVSPTVKLPGFWHFLTFCHSNFSFEPCFQLHPIGHSVAPLVIGSGMECGAARCPARPRRFCDVGQMA